MPESPGAVRSIDFVIRSDGDRKPGGDTIQIHAYAAGLTDQGFDVRVVPFSADLTLRPQSVVHLSNVDRTFEFLAAAHFARRHPLLVSPIHRDSLAFDRMLRLSRVSGRRRQINRIPRVLRELLVFFVRCVARGDSTVVQRGRLGLLASKQVLSWRRSVRMVLDRARQVLVIAEGEAESIQRDFGWNARNSTIVRNSVSTPQTWRRLDWQDRPADALTFVGRIEPGKRPVELAESAHRLHVRVDFIGSPGTDDGYVDKFRSIASESPWVRWTGGGLSHADLLDRLGSSRVLINPSLLEVQSLVDLEAALSGCFVVSTPAGYSEELLPASVLTKLGTFDIEALLNAGLAQAQLPTGPPAVTSVGTWDESISGLARHI